MATYPEKHDQTRSGLNHRLVKDALIAESEPDVVEAEVVKEPEVLAHHSTRNSSSRSHKVVTVGFDNNAPTQPQSQLQPQQRHQVQPQSVAAPADISAHEAERITDHLNTSFAEQFGLPQPRRRMHDRLCGPFVHQHPDDAGTVVLEPLELEPTSSVRNQDIGLKRRGAAVVPAEPVPSEAVSAEAETAAVPAAAEAAAVVPAAVVPAKTMLPVPAKVAGRQISDKSTKTESSGVVVTRALAPVASKVQAAGNVLIFHRAPSSIVGTAEKTAAYSGDETAESELAAEDKSNQLEVFDWIKNFNKHYAHNQDELGDAHDSSLFGDFDEEGAEDEDSDLEDMHYVNESDMMDDGIEDYGNNDEDDDSYADADYSGEDAITSRPVRSSSTALARSVGSIGAFIKAANQQPMLTEDEEFELTRRYRENGDLEAARRLVLSHLRFVVSVARRYTGYGLPLSDLIQEGNIGLMKAVKHFDPDKGVHLAAFAKLWIKAEIHEYVLRNWRMVKVATTKAQRKLFFKLRALKKRLGWFTTDERQIVAADLGVSSSDVAEMETRLVANDIGFDQSDDDNDRGANVPMAPSTYLEDRDSNFALSLENSDYASWGLKKLREALDSLDERSRYILKRRWLEDKEKKVTFQELSQELKVSIERVRQLEAGAMNKIKTMLLHEGVTLNGEGDIAAYTLEDKSSRSQGAAAVTSRNKTRVGDSKATKTRAVTHQHTVGTAAVGVKRPRGRPAGSRNATTGTSSAKGKSKAIKSVKTTRSGAKTGSTKAVVVSADNVTPVKAANTSENKARESDDIKA